MKQQSTLLTILGAGLALLCTSAPDAMADQAKSHRLDSKGKSAASLNDASEPIRAHGSIAVNSSGVRVGQHDVIVGPNTSIFPRQSLSRQPDVRRFLGRRATVFGQSTPNGIAADLIIIHSDRPDHASGFHGTPKDEQWREPVGDGKGGKLNEDVPE